MAANLNIPSQGKVNETWVYEREILLHTSNKTVVKTVF